MNPDRFGVVACVVPLRIAGDERIVGEAHVDREGRVTATVADAAAVRMLMQEAPEFSLGLMVRPEAIERMCGTYLLGAKQVHNTYTDLRSAPGYQVGFFEGDNDWRWRSANAAGFGFKTEAEAIAAAQDHYRSRLRDAPLLGEPLGFKVPTVDEAALASARWLGDTLVTPAVNPADLEGRRARVESIPQEIKTRIALDKLVDRLTSRIATITTIEREVGELGTLISSTPSMSRLCVAGTPATKAAATLLKTADKVGAFEPRRKGESEVYEVAGQEFALPSDVVAELKGAAPLLLEQADAELLVALRAAAGAFARVRELEAGITDALDHLGSAREEDSLDRREQYRAEAERALQGVL